MNQPDTDRLLALLSEEQRPQLSPYFEARLRRRIAEEQQTATNLPLRIRQAAVVFLLLAAVLLWQYPFLRWVVPLLILQTLPEDWTAAVTKQVDAIRHRRM